MGQQPYPLSPNYPFGMYPQGPEGDPFAPPPHFFPVPPPGSAPDGRTEMSQKPVKRSKRKPRREEECGFCAGDDSKNKSGVPERMVTCSDCGRSGEFHCVLQDSCLLIDSQRSPIVYGTWRYWRNAPHLPLEMSRMQNMRDL